MKIKSNSVKKAGFTAAIALVLLLGIRYAIPSFLSVANIMNVIRQSSIIAIPAIGVTMTMIINGIDLSTSGLIAFVPMVAITLYRMGCPFLLSVLIALTVGVMIGFLNGIVISKIGVPPFISTFVFGNITLGLSLVLGNGGSISGFPRAYTRIGNGEFLGVPYSNFILLLFTIAGTLFLSKSRIGNRIYAMGNNEQVVKTEGVNIDRVKILVYTITGFCSAFAGLLLSAQLATVHPLQGNAYQLDCVAACIIGGTSTLGGYGKTVNTVLGAIVIAALRNILNLLGIHPFMQNLILGSLIIGIVAVSIWIKNRELRAKRAY